MRDSRSRLRALAFLAATAMLPASQPGLAQTPGPAAEEEPPAAGATVPAEPPELQDGLYFGPASCGSSNCHGSTRPRRVFDSLQNEYFTWLQSDRHAKAYEVLFNERSRIIGRNFGLAGEPASTPACLSCHTLVVPAKSQARVLEIEDGVSCESCHGPASGWLGAHTEEGRERRDLVAAGLVDLEDLRVRGELCLGCHLGDGEGDRVVDHRLIAAGHPQLVFELDNYGAGMPAHWRPAAGIDGAGAWAAGQVAALKAAADFVAGRARAGAWPEFSLMSCTSCHHSLAEDLWRRSAGGPNLGLPSWSPARYAVLRHLVAEVAPEDRAELDGAVAELSRQISQITSPASRAAASAEEVGRILERVEARVSEAGWGAERLLAVMRRIAGDRGALAGVDFESAEQAMLALTSLTSSLIEQRPEVLRGGLVDAVERLDRLLENPYRFDRGRFAEGLRGVEGEVGRLLAKGGDETRSP